MVIHQSQPTPPSRIAKAERFPDFLIIGAAKSGTTALHYYLQDHPQIFMSPVKEPAYFAYQGATVNFQGPGDDKRNRITVTDPAQYAALFQAARPEQKCGESSVAYLYHPNAPANIQQAIPDVRLVAILRNPVERAFSAFAHLRRDRREPLEDFMQALTQEAQRKQAGWLYIWFYAELGFYSQQISRYLEHFSREQLFVVTYDEYSRHQKDVIARILDHIGVDSTVDLDTSHRFNVSGRTRSNRLHQFLTHPSFSKQLLKLAVPRSIRYALRKNIFSWNIQAKHIQLPDSARAYLNELYADDIQQLSKMLDMDFSEWLT